MEPDDCTETVAAPDMADMPAAISNGNILPTISSMHPPKAIATSN